MKRTQVILLLCLFAVAGLVGWLAFFNRQPPMLPGDRDHAGPADECLVCHGPDGGVPQNPNHPIGNDCMRCHGRR